MKKLTIVLLFIFGISFQTDAQVNKDVYIKVITPENAWVDSQIESKILQSFSSHSNLDVKIVNNNKSFEPMFPNNYYDTESLIEWGKEIGGRYLMIVDIKSERLEKRKSFHIPLIFHKYHTYGVVEGEMRLVDIDRGKLLSSKSFKVEEKGLRAFQATMDDDVNDPDLHISAPNKILFFSKLEDKLIAELKKKTKVYLGLRK